MDVVFKNMIVVQPVVWGYFDGEKKKLSCLTLTYKRKKMDTKENKKSKLYIDDSYDLQLVSKLHPALRWVLMYQ